MFVIGFVPLRMLKGGYHADTHLGCILILILCATLLMLLIKFELWFYSIPILIAATIYLFISQGKNSNQLITEKKQKKFNMTARVIIALYAVFCVIIALIWRFTPIIFALLYGVGIAGISLFVSKHIHKQITE